MALAAIHGTGTRILELQRKLRQRENTPGYEKNCEEIRAEIKRLETHTVRKPKRTARKKEAPMSHAVTILDLFKAFAFMCGIFMVTTRMLANFAAGNVKRAKRRRRPERMPDILHRRLHCCSRDFQL